MKKEILLGVLIVLLLLPFTSAQPPFQQNIDLDIGLQIEAPIIEYHENGEDFTFYIHVFNKTDGILLTNDTVICEAHLYHPITGKHIIESVMDFDSNGVDFELEVTGSDFIDNKQHAILFQCNTTPAGQDLILMGGFLEYPFTTNPTGTHLTEGDSFIYFSLLIATLFIFLLVLWGSIVIPFKNQRSELGKIIKVTYLKYFKILFMSLTYIILVWTFNLLHVLSINFSLLSQYTNYFAIIFKVLNAMVWPIFIFVFVGSLFLLWKDLKLEQLLMRGLDER